MIATPSASSTTPTFSGSPFADGPMNIVTSGSSVSNPRQWCRSAWSMSSSDTGVSDHRCRRPGGVWAARAPRANALAVSEPEGAAGRGFGNGRRDDDLTGWSHTHDAGCKVHGDAADAIVALLDLPDMNACAALKAEVTGRASKRHEGVSRSNPGGAAPRCVVRVLRSRRPRGGSRRLRGQRRHRSGSR